MQNITNEYFTSPVVHHEDLDFSNLYPAVLECFTIILCGYIAGTSKLISHTEARGLNTFVSTFSLPALIFVSISKLELSNVNWVFLGAVFLAKAVVFALVLLVAVVGQRPLDCGRAGLYSIFCTQSNDFALGYPILKALYNESHPSFPGYLYLLSPISLVLLNPVGFVLLEIGKQSSQGSRLPKGQVFLRMTKGVLLNPVVTMTLLGMLGNLVFQHSLPPLLDGVLTTLGAAFSAVALFSLGVTMVGKVSSLTGAHLVLPAVLIAVKTVLLPLVIREVVSLLNPGDANASTLDLSNFGFLYGTFPTAPSVFVFSTQYGVQTDVIATSMVAVTFLSAPLMLISAKMVALARIDPLDYMSELETFLKSVSILGVVASCWAVLVLCLQRRWRSMPHCVTLALAFSQATAAAGALLWSVMDCPPAWVRYTQFAVVTWGVFSARLLTAVLALTLLLQRLRGAAVVKRWRVALVCGGWGIPLTLVTALLLLVRRDSHAAARHDPNFLYGSAQAIMSLLLLWFCLFCTSVCLVAHQRVGMRRPLTPGRVETQPLYSGDETDDEGGSFERQSSSDELLRADHLQPSYGDSTAVVQPEEPQLLRHTVLLLYLCCSMAVGFCLSLWTLLSEQVSGVYVEVVFLDAVLNYCQGVVTALLFGLDVDVFIRPLLRMYASLKTSHRV